MVSIIIVNYNGKEFLDRCINSIIHNNYQNYEIIVADNHSTDNSVADIQKKFAGLKNKLKFVELDQNYGPARARNEAAKLAKGKYLGFLDNDTKVDKNWLTAAINLFKSDNKIGCLQCKLMLMTEPNRFDYAGEFLGQNGFLVQRAGYRELDNGQYDQTAVILAAKSAGMFIRKDVFEKIGGFDDDYFIYVEETDLGWRSWLLGYKTMFCPKSVVYHEFGTSAKILTKKKHNFNVRFHGTKNYLMTLIKNLNRRNLVLIFPRHVIIWIFFGIYLFVTGNFRVSMSVFKGILWIITNIKSIIRKRKAVQGSRILDDDVLFKKNGLLQQRSFLYKIKQYFCYTEA